MKLDIGITWEIKQTDMSKCTVCDDIIFSDMRVLYTQATIDDEYIETNTTDVILCSSCFDILEK